MNQSFINRNNLQLSIRVRGGMRNQEISPTLLTKKALAQKVKVLNLRRKRQYSVLNLFANLLGER